MSFVQICNLPPKNEGVDLLVDLCQGPNLRIILRASNNSLQEGEKPSSWIHPVQKTFLCTAATTEKRGLDAQEDNSIIDV